MARDRGGSTRRTLLEAASLCLAALATTACATAAGEGDTATEQAISPAERSAVVTTTGCGYASDRTGSGVLIGDGLVITVAHLVVQSEDISVSAGEIDLGSATVAGIDLKRDLAALRIEDRSFPAVDTARAAVGATGSVHGGAASGTVAFRVNAVVDVSIEEVLGTERSKRRGYELDALTKRGDSGAGAYDETDRLLGIVFAYSEDPPVTWLTASQEIEAFLDEVAEADAAYVCDPDRSRLDF